MELFINLYPLVFLLGYQCIASELDYDGKLNIKLEHSLEHSPNPVFIYRGTILIKSLHSAVATIEELNLSNEQIQILKDLVKKNGNYRLRATVKTGDGKENYYYTFVKACALVESGLSNSLSINLDHNGNVIAVTISVPSKCLGTEVPDKYLTTFSTSVEIRHMEVGPIPDTATYIQKLEKEREAKERGETKDNRSFFLKYWMYILPVALFMLLPTAANSDSGGAAQR